MPELKIATLDSFGFWTMIAGAILGAFALASTSISAYMLYKASNLAQDEANEKIRTLDLQLVQAKERTEQLRAKNLAMEQWIAPRELTPPQITILSGIKGVPIQAGVEVGVVALYGDIESYRLAEQIANVLSAAGVKASPGITGGSLAKPFFGLGLTVQRGQERLGDALRQAFTQAGIPVNDRPVPGFEGSNATRVYVGLKPWYHAK